MTTGKIRRMLAAMTAAAVIAAMPVSAGAVDYGGGAAPSTPAPDTSTVSNTSTTDAEGKTETTVAGTSEDAPATVLTEEAVEEAIAEAAANGEKEATLYMKEDSSGKVTVPKDTIGAIAKSGVTVTIEVQSDDGPDYSITIDPKLITEVKQINLSMDIQVDVPPTTEASGVDIPAGSVVIAPAQKGDFGMTVTVTLPAATISDMDIDSIMMFYISDNGNVTDMTDSLSLNYSDGTVSFSISHASQYVITDVDLTEDGELTDDSDDEDYDDEDDEDDGRNGKDDNAELVTPADDGEDENPGTGAGIALGAFAVSAAAAVIFSKKKRN